MRALRHGAVLALLAGLAWGALGMLVLGVLLMLLSGAPASPPLGTAALAGALGAAALFAHPAKARRGASAGISALVSLIALMVLTFAQPFGLGLDTAPLWQGVLVLAFAAVCGAANRATLHDTPLAPMSRYDFEKGLIRIAIGVGFVFFTVIVALPFYVMVMTSLKSQQALLANPLDYSISLEQGVGVLLRSYVELFTQYNFGRFLWITSVVSVATVLITLAVSVPGAYAVSRLRFRGRALLSRSILMIYMVPAIVLVIPLYAVFSQLGLRNTLWGLLIVYPATTIPVALYMLQGYFRGLPAELEEAGLMDGLSRLGVIRQITIPLAVPALASVSLYVFMIAWNEFLFAFMFLDDPAIFTLSRGVVALNSSEVPRQHLMAGAVIATVPILVIFLWFEKFLVQGLTAGSVKG